MAVRYLLDTNIVSFHIRQSSPTLQRRLNLMIGAHARAIGATLITANVGEFRRIPGLKIADWSR